jgi:hypothetical protein
MTSRFGVRDPTCKVFTVAFSKSANERASIFAAYLRVSEADAIIQV